MAENIDIRVWVLTKAKDQINPQFHTTTKGFMSTYKHIQSNYEWEMIKVYHKKTNQELKTFYNFHNRKEYPTGADF